MTTAVSIGSQATQTLVCQLAYPVALPVIRYYDGSGGNPITNLPAYTAPYTAAQVLTNGLVAPIPVNRGDNYSARSRGYVRPMVTGLYTIWISSDDAGFFSLGAANGSTCGLPVSVSNAAYSGAQGASGASYTVNLTAGVAYPYEMGYSEGVGGDYIQIDWSVGGSARSVIPASVIFAENPNSLQKRQLTKTSQGGVDTYTTFDGTTVVPTAQQPLVDCGTNYNYDCSSAATPATPLATTVPFADGVADTQRVGAVGTATSASRADHVHPIAKLAQVAFPAVVVGGGNLNAQSVWRQDTTEETQEFSVRVDMTPTAAGTWRTITFPTIPGYQLVAAVPMGLYCPTVLANNPWTGQHFVWGVSTFYWATPAAFVNQQCYWNFNLKYILA
jgi:GLEYA domain